MSSDDFEQRINHFPSSFHLEIEGLNKAIVSSILERLLRELKEDGDTDCDEEMVRKNNLLSFLYWNLEKKIEALQYTEEVIKKDENSILAIANKANYLHYNADFYIACQCLDRLEKLKNHKDYEHFHRKAKAELAYSYSRFGPRFYEKAEKEFEKVIKEEEDNYLWKFGLGLSLQRQMHIYNNPNYFNIKHKEKFKKAVDVLWDVILHTQDANPQLCAKAWVEIGVLLYQKYKDLNNFKSVDLPKGMGHLKYLDCFEKACAISENDVFVLERAGKFYRYSKKLKKSEDVLRKAIKLKETSFAHHHLGITLQKSAFKYERPRSFPPELNQTSVLNSESNSVSHHLFQEKDDSSSIETDGLVASNIQNSQFDRTKNVALPNTIQFSDNAVHNTEAKTDKINIPFEKLSINNNKEDFRYQRQDRGSYGGNIRGNRGMNRGPIRENEARDRGSFRGNGRGNKGMVGRSFRENYSWGRGNGGGYRWTREDTFRGRGWRGGERGRIFTRSYSCTQQNLARAVINSPEKPKISPGNPKLEEAAMHFQKSVDISHGSNLRAQFQLGLTYVQLDEDRNALEAFRVITSRRRPPGAFNCFTSKPSPHNEPFTQMELVTACEQQGLCLQRLSTTCPDEEKDKLLFDSKQLFLMAIQMASDAVAVMPSLKSAWTAFPTLRDLLKKKPNKDLKDVTELARLHELMHEYGTSIEFYEDILNQSTDISERQKSQYAIAKNYVKLQDFDNAIRFLDLLFCTGDRNQIDSQFYIDTYIAGALHALQNGDQEKCSERFQKVFRFCCPCHTDETKEESYDIHILADDHESSEVIHIERLLSIYCQLKVTVNERDVLPGRSILRQTIATIKTSSCIVSVLHSPELHEQTYYFIDNVILSKKTMVIVNVDGVVVPEHLQKFPNTDICKMSEKDIEHCNEKWLEQFFRALGQVYIQH